MILCGDFFQLPPVGGEYIFKSPLFHSCIDFSIQLEEVHRQKESELQSLLTDARRGIFSPASIDLIHTLARPLDDDSCVRLYPHRRDVQKFNQEKIVGSCSWVMTKVVGFLQIQKNC